MQSIRHNDLKGLEIYLKRLLRYSNDHKTSVYKDSKWLQNHKFSIDPWGKLGLSLCERHKMTAEGCRNGFKMTTAGTTRDKTITTGLGTTSKRCKQLCPKLAKIQNDHKRRYWYVGGGRVPLHVWCSLSHISSITPCSLAGDLRWFETHALNQ